MRNSMSNEVPNIDYIVRYCSPSTIENDRIVQAAFDIRNDEEYISGVYIPNKINVNVGLEQVKSILAQKKFRVRPNGRFVVFNIGIIKSYVYKLSGIKISIFHVSPSDPTHAGIFPTDANNLHNRQVLMDNIAHALSEFTRHHPNTIHPIVIPRKTH